MDWLKSPVQFFPPCLGFGCVQARVLVLVPVPHVLLHFVQAPQGLKPPSTEKDKKMKKKPTQSLFPLPTLIYAFESVLVLVSNPFSLGNIKDSRACVCV